MAYFFNLTFFILGLFIVCSPFFYFSVLADSAEAWQIGFQDPATPLMEGIVELHHDLWYFLIIVLSYTFWLLFKIVITYTESNRNIIREMNYAHIIEVVWTVTPALLLFQVAIPSFALLYCMDEVIEPLISLKVVGHQWFWSYEYSDYTLSSINSDSTFMFDSYMIAEDDLQVGQFRLLEVDRRVVLPLYIYVRLIITSTDVLHSWAVPSLGIKLDACPGRLNQVTTMINRVGVYYGQCSEICGINHGFMPIVVEGVDFKDYASWIFIKYSEEAQS